MEHIWYTSGRASDFYFLAYKRNLESGHQNSFINKANYNKRVKIHPKLCPVLDGKAGVGTARHTTMCLNRG